MKKYDQLKLENQICFPLYVSSKEIIRKYKPFLDEVGLTYTSYIVMMVLWEHKEMNVKQLGDNLWLDSGTLTPVLKKMEQKGFITRKRIDNDERKVNITITTTGEELRDKVLDIPSHIFSCTNLDLEEAEMLHKLLYKVISK